LNRLKQTISGLSESAKSTGASLAQFDRQFSQQTQQVQQTIGGSAQRKDAEVMSALQEAAKSVKQASAALQNAARIAGQYGQSL
jgi:gas vesicle protein